MNTMDESHYRRALGDELRRLRKTRRWTRKQLRDRLQIDLSLQTLATYELGTRQCTVVRLAQLSRALGVRPEYVLARVHEKLTTSGYAHTGCLTIDLQRVVRDRQPELSPLRQWASRRLDQTRSNANSTVHLGLPALEYLAALCRMDAVSLIARLRALPAE